jgi:hypothetical protein
MTFIYSHEKPKPNRNAPHRVRIHAFATSGPRHDTRRQRLRLRKARVRSIGALDPLRTRARRCAPPSRPGASGRLPRWSRPVANLARSPARPRRRRLRRLPPPAEAVPNPNPPPPRRRTTSSWARPARWRSFWVCPRCATASCSSATRTRACGWTACRRSSRTRPKTCRCFPSTRASCFSGGWRFASPRTRRCPASSSRARFSPTARA